MWNKWLGRRSTTRFKRLANDFKSRQWPPTCCLLWISLLVFLLEQHILPLNTLCLDPLLISKSHPTPNMLFLYFNRNISQKWEVFVFQSPALAQRGTARVRISDNSKNEADSFFEANSLLHLRSPRLPSGTYGTVPLDLLTFSSIVKHMIRNFGPLCSSVKAMILNLNATNLHRPPYFLQKCNRLQKYLLLQPQRFSVSWFLVFYLFIYLLLFYFIFLQLKWNYLVCYTTNSVIKVNHWGSNTI